LGDIQKIQVPVGQKDFVIQVVVQTVAVQTVVLVIQVVVRID
jgi:hypothetical protein